MVALCLARILSEDMESVKVLILMHQYLLDVEQFLYRRVAEMRALLFDQRLHPLRAFVNHKLSRNGPVGVPFSGVQPLRQD